MKKFAIPLCAAVLCSMMSVSAQEMYRIIPISCPVNTPCEAPQPCAAPSPCDETPSPEEIAAKKQEFMEKRCCIYKKVGMNQGQIDKAKCIDEKFFEDICPLKVCYKKEKCKLEEMECSKACDADIKAQKTKVRDLHKQLKAKKKAHHEAILCLLNDCQKKIYNQICKEEKKKHKPKKRDCGCDCKK